MMRRKRNAGFTLVEMIMVIVITGIIAGMVAVFLKSPVEGYFSTVRRAALSEEADAALRFIARDLQSALPNSITCTDAGTLQFLTVRSGGRYREAPSKDGPEIPLVFGALTGSSGSFDMIGNGTATTTDARGNSAWGPSSRVVVGNLSSGVDGCHSYSSADAPVFADNATATAPSLSASRVTFSKTNPFPVACNLASPIVQSNSSQEVNNREFGRFYVVDSSPVSYACNSNANGGLKRTTGDGTALLVDPSHVVVGGCHFACEETKGRVQMIMLNLSLQDKAKEQINLLRRVTIVNRP